MQLTRENQRELIAVCEARNAARRAGTYIEPRRPGRVFDSAAADKGDIRGSTFIRRTHDAAAAPAKATGGAAYWCGLIVEIFTRMMADPAVKALLAKGAPAPARPAVSTGAGAEAPDVMEGEDSTGSALPAQRATDAAARGLDALLPARPRFITTDGASSITMLMATTKEHTEPASLDGLLNSIRAKKRGR
jgi:hypothetical protein